MLTHPNRSKQAEHFQAQVDEAARLNPNPVKRAAFQRIMGDLIKDWRRLAEAADQAVDDAPKPDKDGKAKRAG